MYNHNRILKIKKYFFLNSVLKEKPMKKYRLKDGKILYVKNTRTLVEEMKNIGVTDVILNQEKHAFWFEGIDTPYYVGPGLQGLTLQEVHDVGLDILISDMSPDSFKWTSCLYLKDTYIGEEIKETPAKKKPEINWEEFEYRKDLENQKNLYHYGTTDKKKVEEIKKEQNSGCAFIIIIFIGIPIVLFILNWILYALGLPTMDFSLPGGSWEPRHT